MMVLPTTGSTARMIPYWLLRSALYMRYCGFCSANAVVLCDYSLNIEKARSFSHNVLNICSSKYPEDALM